MPRTYRLLLKQHIGGPAVPTVRPGDSVARGAVIAEPAGLGAKLHASVSGTIAAVDASAITITANPESDRAFLPIPAAKNIAEKVKEAGIVGMGGAGFPSHIKLSADLSGGVVIANGVECEPVLAHNIRQLVEQPEAVIKGLEYAMSATGASRGIIAVKAKNSLAVASLRKALTGSAITIAELPDIYPMGEERAIIRETLGQLLAADQLPSAAQAAVLNVETLSRITDAVDSRKPVISKHITVAGRLRSGTESRVFMDVPLGTRIGDLLEEAGGIADEYGEIIMGGPFTGQRVSLDDVVTKTTGGILVTMPFPRESRKMGLLVCACGASEARLREIASSMGALVVGVEQCKQVVDVRGSLKCENPGNCPGQAEKVLKLRKNGAEVLLISNCSDCSNTVMGVAPKLKLPVYHHTDHVMRTVHHPLIRKLKV